MKATIYLLNFLALGAFQAQASAIPVVEKDQSSANPLAPRQSIYKPCNNGEIGLGVSQHCGITTGCGGEFATIFDNTCNNQWSVGNDDPDVCKGGWTRGWSVSCSGGNPREVRDGSGKRYGNCYVPKEGYCGLTIGWSSLYNVVQFCCRPL
ncbi:hypothetical protein VTJ49DRAFT_7210 [Mycothermus thermophilus]|uniref:Uncharacterized protein n=1 Tax=Humicola insolens TaxID=85995 RepID=A0ABR3VQL9_HUMIN